MGSEMKGSSQTAPVPLSLSSFPHVFLDCKVFKTERAKDSEWLTGMVTEHMYKPRRGPSVAKEEEQSMQRRGVEVKEELLLRPTTCTVF